MKDLEDAWAGGELDDALSGQWVEENNEGGRVTFVKTDAGYHITSGTSGLEGAVKSIAVGEHTFIIVAQLRAAVLGFDQVDDGKKSGSLLRYAVADGKLTVYQMDQDTLEAAIKAGDVPGEALEDEAPTLLTLDDASLAWLAKVSAQDAGWSKTVYVKTK